MGTNTLLSNFMDGSDAEASQLLQVIEALNGILIPRTTGGLPETSGGQLGTAVNKFAIAYIDALISNGQQIDFSLIATTVNRLINGRVSPLSSAPRFINLDNMSPTKVIEVLAGNVGGTNHPALNFVANGKSASINPGSMDTAASLNFTSSQLGPDPSQTENQSTLTFPSGRAADRVGDIDYFQDSLGIGTLGKIPFLSRVGQYITVQSSNGPIFGFLRNGNDFYPIRTFFLRPNNTGFPRQTLFTSTSVTLLKTVWVFADADNPGTLQQTDRSPTIGATGPAGVTGSYWLDTKVDRWKRHNGTDFVVVNQVPIAVVCMNNTQLVGYRCFDFAKNYKNINTLEWERDGNTYFCTNGGAINIGGNDYQVPRFYTLTPSTSNPATLVNDVSRYFVYLTEKLEFRIDTLRPVWRGDFRGRYHPYENWRCVLELNNTQSGSVSLTDNSNWFPWQKYNTLAEIPIEASHNDATSIGTTGSVLIGNDFLASRVRVGAAVRYFFNTGVFSSPPSVGIIPQRNSASRNLAACLESAISTVRFTVLSSRLNAAATVDPSPFFSLVIRRSGNDLLQAQLDNRYSG